MLVEEVGGVEGRRADECEYSVGWRRMCGGRTDLLPFLSFSFKMNMISLTWAAVDHWLSVKRSDVVAMIDRRME
jgi:hypothetical protein